MPFGVPTFVEGETAEVAAHLVAAPLSLLGTVALVVGILYVADLQDVRVHDPILGVVPAGSRASSPSPRSPRPRC